MERDGSPTAHEQLQEPRHQERQQDEADMLETDLRNLRGLLDDEKELYPAASIWAAAEERLFEVLFLRQCLPLLPSHWAMDFHGFPMPGSVFRKLDDYPSVVYPHSPREFRATKAITRLINLTADVRTALQLKQGRKAPSLIKSATDRYLRWAAEDAGYQHLRYLPNIIVATVDAMLGEAGVTRSIHRRMHALARLQREFLKEPRDADFWYVDGKDVGDRWAHHPRCSRLIRKCMRDDADAEQQTRDFSVASAAGDEMDVDDEPSAGTQIQTHSSPMSLDETTVETGSQASSQSRCGDVDVGMADMGSNGPEHDGAADNLYHLEAGGPRTWAESPGCRGASIHDDAGRATPSYHRRPSVVYGLFVMRATVFLVTLDSAKGRTAPVSFHVDLSLHKVRQSFWNALTIAVAACLARDDLLARIDD